MNLLIDPLHPTMITQRIGINIFIEATTSNRASLIRGKIKYPSTEDENEDILIPIVPTPFLMMFKGMKKETVMILMILVILMITFIHIENIFRTCWIIWIIWI